MWYPKRDTFNLHFQNQLNCKINQKEDTDISASVQSFVFEWNENQK